MKCIRFALPLLLALGSSRALADERYAIVIGHNHGDADEAPLRYAERDAQKLAGVLKELGEVRSENTVVLLGESADAVRRAIISVNERIRTQTRLPATLVVFYSGHADANALHLGGTELPLAELEGLVRGSAAVFRLLVLDSCRSGAMTRVKGGRPVAAIPLFQHEQMPGEGVVFLSASSASEDAQESDALQGSFFTHYLVTGLRGAADKDRNGAVDLDEAYGFAFDNTLRASSRTLAGMQHPTYRHELKGQGQIVLTRWRGVAREAYIELPKDDSWLLFQGSEEGVVIAELHRSEPERTIAVPAGSYFVRGRTRDGLLEGTLTVAKGEIRRVAELPLERIEYARLVRKGGYEAPPLAHGAEAGYRVRPALESNGSLCEGAYGAYTLDTERVTFMTRVGFCVGGYANGWVEATSYDFDIELRLHRAFDLPWFTVEVGTGAGGSWLGQRFESRALTPNRDALAGHLDAALAFVRDIDGPNHLRIEAAAMLYLFKRETSDDTRLEPVFVPRLIVGLGHHF
jgi:hypothetical protein